MDHEKKCGCQHDCDCNNMEEVKAEIKETAHEVQEKIQEVKDRVVEYAQDHDIPEKIKATADKAAELAKEAKEKYDSASPETKAKIKQGVKTGAMTLGILMVLKKIFGKKK